MTAFKEGHLIYYRTGAVDDYAIPIYNGILIVSGSFVLIFFWHNSRCIHCVLLLSKKNY